MAENSSIISFRNVSKTYNIGGNKVNALQNATFSIKSGEFVSIIGPSGSGKSTMMNIIGCLDTCDSGEYCLNGQSIDKYSEKELTRIRNRQIGFVFQNFNLIGNLSAEENIELPLIYQRIQKDERKIKVNEALERVALATRRYHKPSELSGGQQQRVAIARAIVTHPSIFLADEPTGNLDSGTGREILSIFRELNLQGHTVILITHDDFIAAQASRILHIFDGEVTE